MGACCTCQRGRNFDGLAAEDDDEDERKIEGDDVVGHGDCGAYVRVQGSSNFISMFSQQGRKGVNQDAMTVWENFTGDKDAVFCGVFDGHGPSGHKVARYVRDILPSKLTSSLKQPQSNPFNGSNNADDQEIENVDDHADSDIHSPVYLSVKASLIKSFNVIDGDLETETMIDSYCSGSTAVTVLKKGKHLMIANLGDSRAIICTKDNKNQRVPVQLTVDLKPNVPSECERIRNCNGRVMALEGEPTVFRVWMPDQDCPGLAMARAFGDFCLKDFGLISIPEVFYRKLKEKDEFVVLATDGIWDVLSNNEVIRIVASARKRSMAARLLVDRAVQAWRYKFPIAKVDDCAVICLFFKRQRPNLTKSMSEVTQLSSNYSDLGPHPQPGNLATKDGLETVLNCDVKADSNDHQSVPHEESTRRTGLLANRRRPSRDSVSVEN